MLRDFVTLIFARIKKGNHNSRRSLGLSLASEEWRATCLYTSAVPGAVTNVKLRVMLEGGISL